MQSIRTIYKIGNGPSSSHTMGPKVAATMFLEKYPNADHYVVELYGSLALTGKGHLTDWIILETLGKEKTEVKFVFEELPFHPNGMKFYAYLNGALLGDFEVYSIGGGEIYYPGQENIEVNNIYKLQTMKDILKFCNERGISLLDYIIEVEDASTNKASSIIEFADIVFTQMIKIVEEGLNREDVLPGSLKIPRRAKKIYQNFVQNSNFDSCIFASALAVSEMNASGGVIVTAPTCGASGVLPGVLYSHYITSKYPRKKILEAILIAGLIGNLIRHNASISGAEVGCQGEVGAACSMASAAMCYLLGGNNSQIEYAAEIGLEHCLGMTCDPVGGYVQIPCIERNAISAKKAVDCAEYAFLSDGNHYISLDHVIKTMMKTGRDLHHKYRETSLGGLAIDEE